MSCILHIETSTKVCSVAVTEDGAVLFEKVDKSGPSHAVQLGVFVDEAISYIDNHGIPFDAVAVSQGPGSYTGLRIGVSMAKGICYARGLKLIAVPTLELLCVPVLLYQEDLPEDALLCPMIDAQDGSICRFVRQGFETGTGHRSRHCGREHLPRLPERTAGVLFGRRSREMQDWNYAPECAFPSGCHAFGTEHGAFGGEGFCAGPI